MKTPWLSCFSLLAVSALAGACSGAGGTSLEDYTAPAGDDSAADASTTGTIGPQPTTTATTASTAPTPVTPTTTTTSTGADAGITGATGTDAGGGAATDASTAISCPYTGTPFPTSTYPACGSGAVCAPTGLIPPASQADFATCSGGLCVPTKVLAAYGNYVPTTCTSLEGAEGRCLNQVLPSVAPQVSELPRDVCDADESCVPCFDPLTGDSTGACNTVSCDAPKKAAVTFASCCFDIGKCVPASLAGSAASSLQAEGCAGGNVCAPTENLEPTFQPQPCSDPDFDVFFGYTGFCVSNCIPNDNGLDQANCDGLHYCAPCNDPFSGDPTGVPGCNN